jgi:hypothetical protein
MKMWHLLGGIFLIAMAVGVLTLLDQPDTPRDSVISAAIALFAMGLVLLIIAKRPQRI